MIKVILLIALIINQPLYAVQPTCNTNNDAYTLYEYIHALSSSPLKAAGLEIAAREPFPDQVGRLYKYLQAMGNSAVTISENGVFKKGELDFGYPVEVPGFEGYRIQTHYTILRGLKSQGQSFPKRAILKTVDLIAPDGKTINILKSKDGAPPKGDTFFILPKLIDSMPPMTLQRAVKKEISRISKSLEAAPETKKTQMLALKIRLEAVLKKQDVPSMRKELNLVLREKYETDVAVPEASKFEVEIFLESPTIDAMFKFLSSFYTNPSKKLSRRAIQEELQKIEDPASYDAQVSKQGRKNFGNWLRDRTKRQFGNAPSSILIALLAGAVGAAISAYFGFDPEKQINGIINNTDVVNDKVVVKTPSGNLPLTFPAVYNGRKITLELVHLNQKFFAFKPLDANIRFKYGDKLVFRGDDGKDIHLKLNKDNLKQGLVFP